MLDPARLEADIVSQLYSGSTSSLVWDDYGPPLVIDSQAWSLLSSSTSALYSSNVVPVHTPSVSLPRFNNLMDQSTSVEVNPALFPGENHYVGLII